MKTHHKLLIMIPARSGSKGLVDKNIMCLAGKPLLAWPILAALDACISSHVVLSTDSQKYADIGLKYGAEVPFLRPEYLASDLASSCSVIEHCLKWFEENKGEYFDYVALLEPTSPLTEAKDLQHGYNCLVNSSWAKSLTTVSKAESFHPSFCFHLNENSKLVPANGYPNGVRRQELQDVYYLDGGLYISKVDALLQNKGFYHDKTMAISLEPYKSIEVDSLKDFYCAEALIKNKKRLIEYEQRTRSLAES